MFKSLFAGALASLAAGAAVAADLPGRYAPASPSYAAFGRPFSWTGAYAGVNAGYASGEMTKSAKDAVGNVGGPQAGVTVGYNQQFQQVVVGAESDLDWSHVNGSTGPNAARATTLGTLRARAGYAADRALVYGTAGYAGGSVRVGTGVDTGKNWENGYAFGAGVEYAFTDSISAKAELLHTKLQDKNYLLPPITSAGASLNAIRTGVNVRF